MILKPTTKTREIIEKAIRDNGGTFVPPTDAQLMRLELLTDLHHSLSTASDILFDDVSYGFHYNEADEELYPDDVWKITRKLVTPLDDVQDLLIDMAKELGYHMTYELSNSMGFAGCAPKHHTFMQYSREKQNEVWLHPEE